MAPWFYYPGRKPIELVEVMVAKTWAVSFGEKERLELERIIMDEDIDSAMEFLNTVIYTKVKEAEKTGSCYHDVDKTVDGVERPVDRHKKLGQSGRG